MMHEHVDYEKDIPQNGLPKVKNKSKPKMLVKVLIITFSVLSVLLIAGFALIPHIVMDNLVNNHVSFKKTYVADQYGIVSGKLRLTTSDGLKIAAYEIESPSPKAVVIFLSGIQGPPVTVFYGHAAMLQKYGYSSILCEMRAHGESDGDVIGLGYKEPLDVKAVVDYIKSSEKYKNTPIVICGLSMGGAVAINSIGEIPEIAALISMSAFSSWEDAFCDNMLRMGAPKFICYIEGQFVKLYTGFKYGFNSINMSPKNEIKKLGNRPALIFHSRKDSQVPYSHFERIMKNGSSSTIETWVKDGDYHIPTESFGNPENDAAYSKRIIEFLERHFNNEKVSSQKVSDFYQQ